MLDGSLVCLYVTVQHYYYENIRLWNKLIFGNENEALKKKKKQIDNIK